jgi:hypothetical protein
MQTSNENKPKLQELRRREQEKVLQQQYESDLRRKADACLKLYFSK